MNIGYIRVSTRDQNTGRKPITHPDFDRICAQWKRGEITAVEAMRRLGMKASTFYRKAKHAGYTTPTQ